MSKQYDDTNRGALHKNDRKESEKHPDYKGSLNVGGKDFWVAAWIRTSKKGQKFMSLSVQSKDKNERAGTLQHKGGGKVDEDIPF